MSIGQTLLVPLMLGLAGCAGMTGLDGQGGFSCKAPDGISCASLSGIYANAVQNNLPGQRPAVKPGNALNAQARIDAMAPRFRPKPLTKPVAMLPFLPCRSTTAMRMRSRAGSGRLSPS